MYHVEGQVVGCKIWFSLVWLGRFYIAWVKGNIWRLYIWDLLVPTPHCKYNIWTTQGSFSTWSLLLLQVTICNTTFPFPIDQKHMSKVKVCDKHWCLGISNVYFWAYFNVSTSLGMLTIINRLTITTLKIDVVRLFCISYLWIMQ
jgi:hypothetical protein